jgi:hypothetical protein
MVDVDFFLIFIKNNFLGDMSVISEREVYEP